MALFDIFMICFLMTLLDKALPFNHCEEATVNPAYQAKLRYGLMSLCQ